MMPEDMLFGPRTDDIMDRAIPDQARLCALWENAQIATRFPGAFAELGVYKGGSALLMYEAAKHEKVMHLFDTFTGIPKDDVYPEGHLVGEFSDTSVTTVRSLFNEAPNVLIHRGFFPATAAPLSKIQYSMVHIDADLYESTVAGLDYFFPHLSAKGRIILDDYGWSRCPGVERAWHEFMKKMALTEEDVYTVEEAPYQLTILKLRG